MITDLYTLPFALSSKSGFTEAECAADCSASTACQAISYCATNPACMGACHLYTTTETGAPSGWKWDKSGGGKLPVTKATTESWWRCLVKNSTDAEAVVSKSTETAVQVETMQARHLLNHLYFTILFLLYPLSTLRSHHTFVHHLGGGVLSCGRFR